MKKIKLLVLDDYENELSNSPAMNRLKELADVTILNHPIQDKADLKNYQAVLALRERTTLDETFFSYCDNLELILQTGGHAYHIDENTATRQGIVIALGRRVTKPMVVVPELVFSFILSLIRNIHQLTIEMKEGKWPVAMGTSLSGRTIGILGYGRHGRAIGRIASAFGMKVIAWDRGKHYETNEMEIPRLPLDELLACSDIVSVHLRLSQDVHGLLNSERINKMKHGALLINTSRGAIIDEEALADALLKKHLAGAGLDVFCVEPLPVSSPLRSLPNVLLTPHIGWKVKDVLHEFVQVATEQLSDWLEGKLAKDEVLNPEAINLPRTRSGNLFTN